MLIKVLLSELDWNLTRIINYFTMELEIYQDQNGNEPFLEWLSSIRDKSTAARIRNRLRRIEETGNLGDYRSVGSGVYEIRMQFSPG